MNDLEVNLQQLKMKQENTEQRISDVTKEVESFLQQFMKYQKTSTQLTSMMNEQQQHQINRITEMCNNKARQSAMRQQQKQKQEQLLRPVEPIREDFQNEFDEEDDEGMQVDQQNNNNE